MGPCSRQSPAQIRQTQLAGVVPEECPQSRGSSSGPSPGLGRGPAVQASRRKRLRPAPSSAPAAGPAGAGRGRALPAGRAPSAAGAAPPPRPLIGCGPGGGARGSRLAPLSGAFGASAMAESGETRGRRGGRGCCSCPRPRPPALSPSLSLAGPGVSLSGGGRPGTAPARASARAPGAGARVRGGRSVGCSEGGRCGSLAGGSAGPRPRRDPLRAGAEREDPPGSALGWHGPAPAVEPRRVGWLSRVLSPVGALSARAAAAGASGHGWGWKHACPRGARCLSCWRTVKAIDRRYTRPKRSVFLVLPRGAAGSANATFTPALSNTDPGLSQLRCPGAALLTSWCPAATRRGPPCSSGHLASPGCPLPARGIQLLTLNPQPWPWAACLLLDVGLGPFVPCGQMSVLPPN